MIKLKPTIVASMVAAAFASTAADAALGDRNSALNNFDKSTTSKNLIQLKSTNQKRLAERRTQSGMPSQYDAEMGAATFLWAPEGQAKPDMGLVPVEDRAKYAADFYMSSMTGASVDKNAVAYASMKYMDDRQNSDAIMAKYTQEIRGVEVFNKEYNIIMDKEFNLVAGSGYFAAPSSAQKTLSLFANFGNAEAAVQKALSDLTDGEMSVSMSKMADKGRYEVYDATSNNADLVVIGNPRAKRVFYDFKGNMTAAYYVEAEVALADSTGSTAYSYVISAENNEILFRKNLVAHANEFTYRAYAHPDGYPMEGPHGNVLPALVPGEDPTAILPAPLITIDHFSAISTDDPWLPEDATTTRGNNVYSYADVVPPQDFSNGDFTAEITSDRTFDYQLDRSERDNSLNNRKAAIVNLFYFNNFMHDFYYDYGFDEAAGNGQMDNFGRGGEGGDPLEVQAQDFSGLNNANMATFADGTSSRMQQFLWNDKDATNGVEFGFRVSEPFLGLFESTRIASFGPSQYEASGYITRIDDGNAVDSSSATDGCEAAINDPDGPDSLVGKIAIIDRGSCAFTQKVINAQNAGAIAAIIVNNIDDGTPAPMGGSDPAVTIPAIGLNFEEGHSIYAELDEELMVFSEMFSTFPLKDSTFDNGIIAHEWGHFIQNRLVGNASGLNNFQGRAMGEGWADVHSLIFIVLDGDREITGNENFMVPYATGTYVEDFFFGIRRAPYTPNMDINPLTFQHIAGGAQPPGLAPTSVASPHAPGEVWAVTLWDIYVHLLNTYEFEEAQSRFVNYLVMGYKMTPVSPTYTEARDAILSVMFASDREDYTAALAAFARRGMGLDAVSPPRGSTDLTEVQEGFATQLAGFQASEFNLTADYDGVELGWCTADGILDQGETGTVAFRITNSGSETLVAPTAQLAVTSGQDVTFENDGVVTFGDLEPFQSAYSGPIEVTLNSAEVSDTLNLEVQFPRVGDEDSVVRPAPLQLSTAVNLAFMKRNPVDFQTTTDMETRALFDDFKERVLTGGSNAEGTQGIDNTNVAGFFQPLNPDINLGSQAMILTNNAFQSDVVVETDPIVVGFGSNFSMNFWHFYWLEERFDGGIIEISINEGEWTDVADVAGAEFAVGYSDQTLFTGNPAQALQGRNTYTGITTDFATFAGNMESVSFGDSLNGQTVRMRFRLSTDSSAADFGWVIDNVTFTNVENAVFSDVVTGVTEMCNDSAPRVMIPEVAAVSEDGSGSITVNVTDRDTDMAMLSYAWTQTAGPEATITSEEGAATLEFTPPAVSEDTTLTFQVTVSDATNSVSSSVDVMVTNITPTPAPTPNAPTVSSGGGSVAWYSLLLLPLAWVRRRRQSH